MIESNDASLVKQCLEGNVKAFERLVDRHQKTVFNVALRIINDYAEAEDIAQTVFIRAYEKLASFDPKHKFFSWLYRMTVNESLNTLKQRQRKTELDESFVSGDKTPEEHYEENEMTRQIEIALMRLDPEQRALIVLKHFQNMAYEEIGFIFDIPEKTVKSRLYSARQMLRTVLLKQGIVANG